MTLATFIHGSAHDLHAIPDASVQMIATSPPYYSLRAYAGEQAIEWPAVTYRLNEWVEPTTIAGCAPECEHEWTDQWGGESYKTDGKRKWQHGATRSSGKFEGQPNTLQGAFCARCGGWRGALGMEPSPVAYIGHMILCLREWRRVLRDDGVCFVNLGDSYAGSGGAGGDYNKGGLKDGQPKYKSAFRPGSGRADGIIDERGQRNRNGNGGVPGIKPKDLLMIPAMFAIAARADGWYLRSDIIWAKGESFNPDRSGSSMPGSQKDRPTLTHEHIFLLAKSGRYHFAADAIAEPAIGGGTRMVRSVWSINTKPSPLAHFATWPPKLAETMVKAGSRAGDTVLDPFSGSGTTGEVAVRLGRRYIGVDISRTYLYDVTAERFGGGVQMEITY